MKILFIKPSSADREKHSIDIPMGILCLSAYLKENYPQDLHVSLLDMRLESSQRDSLDAALSRFQPELIGISMMSCDRPFLTEYGDLIANRAPQALLVFGGPYPTTCYDDILSDVPNSIVVIGEGEIVMLNIVEAYAKGSGVYSVPGIAYCKNKKIVLNEQENYLPDLDMLPVPDYSLIDMQSYWNTPFQMNIVLAEKKYIPVMSSRGCPYRCIYCHNIFGKKIRKRSPKHFFREIEMLYTDYGIREFHFIDDIFNLDRDRMKKILNLIIESGMRIRIAFPNGLRGDLLQEEDLVLLKKAGAYMVSFAIESASERIQQLAKKYLDIDQVISNIDYANRLNLITNAFFMIGFPGETPQEMNATINLALKSKLNVAFFSTVVPFKRTPLHQLACKVYENVAIDTFDTFTLGAQTFYHEATGYDIGKLQTRAYIKFYSPWRIVRLMLKVPRKIFLLKTLMRAALKLLSASKTRQSNCA